MPDGTNSPDVKPSTPVAPPTETPASTPSVTPGIETPVRGPTVYGGIPSEIDSATLKQAFDKQVNLGVNDINPVTPVPIPEKPKGS